MLEEGPVGFPETSATNYEPGLPNIPEERRPHLHRGGTLKARNPQYFPTKAVELFL